METIRQYILSVICTVIVCGIVQMFFTKGTAASMIKMLSGLIVTIAVLSPLLKDKILQWDFTLESITAEGEVAASDGVSAAQDAQKQIIKQKTQAYILSKAKEMGADVTVDVQLQDAYPNLPQTVTVTGLVSPYVKQRLTDFICQDLGIAEEEQIWIS